MATTTFFDLGNNFRRLDFNVGDAFRIAADTGIDLMDLDSIIDACTKPPKLMELLYELSKRPDETFETFCSFFTGKTLDDAHGALWEAIENFTPRDRTELVRALVAKVKETDTEIVVRAVENLTPKKSGSLLGNVELTPEDTPTAN